MLLIKAEVRVQRILEVKYITFKKKKRDNDRDVTMKKTSNL